MCYWLDQHHRAHGSTKVRKRILLCAGLCPQILQKDYPTLISCADMHGVPRVHHSFERHLFTPTGMRSTGPASAHAQSSCTPQGEPHHVALSEKILPCLRRHENAPRSRIAGRKKQPARRGLLPAQTWACRQMEFQGSLQSRLMSRRVSSGPILCRHLTSPHIAGHPSMSWRL